METDHTQQLPYWLAARYIPRFTPRVIKELLLHFSDISRMFQATRDALIGVGLQADQVDAIQAPDWRAVERDLQWANAPEHHLVTWGDHTYPALLREIYDSPPVLFVQGDHHALNKTQLAMVGARKASPAGLQAAEEFAYQLARVGYVVTSGLALGIDGASHRGALKAEGVTIAVAGTGLHYCYPSSHQQLAQKIISSGGAIVSEFSLDMPPRANHFPRRNRIISGLSLGVLVVEAALKSGSMITVRFALEQGREVFAVPGSIYHPQARGCHHLIRQGAKLVEKAEDIIEEFQQCRNRLPVPKAQPDRAKKEQSLQPEHSQLLDMIGYELTPLDMIICRSGLTAGQLSSILLRLEFSGHIQSLTGGYVRVPKD